MMDVEALDVMKDEVEEVGEDFNPEDIADETLDIKDVLDMMSSPQPPEEGEYPPLP